MGVVVVVVGEELGKRKESSRMIEMKRVDDQMKWRKSSLCIQSSRVELISGPDGVGEDES